MVPCKETWDISLLSRTRLYYIANDINWALIVRQYIWMAGIPEDITRIGKDMAFILLSYLAAHTQHAAWTQSEKRKKKNTSSSNSYGALEIVKDYSETN